MNLNEWRKRENYINWVFKIKNPNSFTVGNNDELNEEVKSGALFLCVLHTGDYFETYIKLEYHPKIKMLFSYPKVIIGSYGLGDATKIIKLNDEQVRSSLLGRIILIDINMELNNDH